MHLLSLGTLDSFFVRVVGAFPLEFGLGGAFSMIVDKPVIEEVRARVADRVFREVVESKGGLNEFLEAFKQATFGMDGNRFSADLDKFIEDYQSVYLDVPEGERWGNASVIWPNGDWALKGDGSEELNAAVGRLAKLSPQLGPDDKQQARWRAFYEDVGRIVPGTGMPGGVSYLLGNFLKSWGDLKGGQATVTIERKKIEFDALACEAVVDFIEAVVACDYRAKLIRTRGLWKVINEYELCYDKNVRRRGQLQFGDVARVMGGPNGLASVDNEEGNAALTYRLDAEFDHWLLDEFQDTSRMQWKAISGLVDEVVQDSEGRRSYFQVGDTKQSIYGWRGGDPKLFNEVLELYKNGVEVKSLAVSYRSGPDVIEMVNQAFDDRDLLKQWLPDAAVDAFHWKKHSCSNKTEGLGGYAALWHPNVEKVKEEDVLDLLVETVKEIDPLGRGLSCAILCRGGKMIDKVMDRLRSAGIEEVDGGAKASAATDNPVTLALLSLIKLAGHPGDTFAEGHLAMTAIGDWMKREACSKGKLVMESLRLIHAEGFEQLVELWQQRLKESGDLDDAFACYRLSALKSMARNFDEDGDRSVDGFLDFVRGQKMQETSSGNAIQVMTIHNSKGLGFDVVILPELTGGSKTLTHVDSGLSQGATEGEAWVMDMPNKEFQQLDPLLKKHREDLEAASGFESLCVLYVAMTRAKQGLYLLSPPRGKSTASNFLGILNAALNEEEEEADSSAVGDCEVEVIYERGDRRWFEDHEQKEKEASGKDLVPSDDEPIELGFGGRRAKHHTASEHEQRKVGAELLFSSAGSDARNYGNEVHAVFEQIEWIDGEQGVDDVLQGIQAGDEVVEDVRQCLSESTVLELFRKKEGVSEVWCEKAFELLLDGEWISGVFDRVVLIRDGEGGKVLSADIVDYKTSRVEGEEEIAVEAEYYRSQMTVYRQALAKLTSMDEKAIRCLLVFTRPRVVWEVMGEL
ncbi:MAG: UvrD-helicase domain-containing protein [Verrucomicrobia bacterium]|nr:UvrD-helicase domain-containing protein [Verrucomicrobiota bacterium]